MDDVQLRRQALVELVNAGLQLHFSAIEQAFPDVSAMTLRKDLKALDEAGLLVRVHGGARAVCTVGAERTLGERMVQQREEKQALVKKACALIAPGQTVFLDSGSTMTLFADVFPDVPCKVITGGLSVVSALQDKARVDIRMLGGRINKQSLSVRDAACALEVSRQAVDVAFLSAQGFSMARGFMCRSEARWHVERAVVASAGRVVVLMDSSKTQREAQYTFAMPNEVQVLVSDAGLDAGLRAALTAQGVDVL